MSISPAGMRTASSPASRDARSGSITANGSPRSAKVIAAASATAAMR
jgi:hypothetical protein